MPVIYQNQIGFDGSISYRDGANLDAFGRLRVSTPHTLFDSHNEFGLDTYNIWGATANNKSIAIYKTGSLITGSECYGGGNLLICPNTIVSLATNDYI